MNVAVGLDGAAGAAGPKGDKGDPGTDGKDGADGTDGQPPAGWTYTDPAGIEYACSPVDGFDTTSPRYTCTADSAAPTSSPTGSSLLGIVMMSASAAYRRL